MELGMKLYSMAMGLWGYLHSPEGANLVLGIALLSESLGSSDKVKSNSVYQLFMSGLKMLKEKVLPKKDEK